MRHSFDDVEIKRPARNADKVIKRRFDGCATKGASIASCAGPRSVPKMRL